MSYDLGRYHTLSKLGIEQLPLFGTPKTHCPLAPFSGDVPLRTNPVPGRKCPNCLDRGQTVWVIPGKRCPQCGTAVN